MLGLTRSEQLEEIEDSSIGEFEREKLSVSYVLNCVARGTAAFDFASLRALREEGARASQKSVLTLPGDVGDDVSGTAAVGSAVTGKLLPEGAENVSSNSSLTPAHPEPLTTRGEWRELAKKPSSNVFTLPKKTTKGGSSKGASLKPSTSSDTVVPLAGSHVAADCLVTAPGASLATADIRLAYEAWCAANGHEPLSQQKLSAKLLRLGCSKWKSCGLIRYRDLQLAA